MMYNFSAWVGFSVGILSRFAVGLARWVLFLTKFKRKLKHLSLIPFDDIHTVMIFVANTTE